MKATELMIGDWVSQSNGNPVRLDWVKTGEYGYYDKNGIPQIACTPLLKPIPLTPEILEKNGFYKDWDGITYLMGKIFRLFPMTDGMGYILNDQFSIQIYSVHELQHALRLCGLTELADNFRVE